MFSNKLLNSARTDFHQTWWEYSLGGYVQVFFLHTCLYVMSPLHLFCSIAFIRIHLVLHNVALLFLRNVVLSLLSLLTRFIGVDAFSADPEHQASVSVNPCF